jgi:hypothetical protein
MPAISQMIRGHGPLLRILRIVSQVWPLLQNLNILRVYLALYLTISRCMMS